MTVPSNIHNIKKYSPGNTSMNLNKPKVIIVIKIKINAKYLKNGHYFSTFVFI